MNGIFYPSTIPTTATTTTSDGKVKVDTSDTPGYLSDKIDETTLEVDTTNHKIKVKDGTFAPSEHTHDDRYCTKTEVDSKLSNKSDVGHMHSWADIDKTGSKLTDIGDVPDYNGNAGKVLTVNSTEDGLVFSDLASSGDSVIQYVEDTKPNISVNPPNLYALWLDRQNFELWRCDDNTPDKNVWVSNFGNVIAYLFVYSNDRFNDGSMIANFNFNNNFSDKCNNYNLTPLGSYEFIDGVFDKAVKITSSWVDLGANIEGDISVSLFIKGYVSAPTQASQTIAISQNGSGYHHLLLNSDDVLGFYNNGWYLSSKTLEEGKDYHIVFTKTGTNQKIYVNGELVLDSNSSFENTGIMALRYFGNYSGGSQLCHFGIDQIEIYNRVLTEDEINSIYNEALSYGNFSIL
jgi:hypothetical protein